MKRRLFLGTALATTAAPGLFAAAPARRWDAAAEVLERATATKQVAAAVLHVVHKGESCTRHFGTAGTDDAMFLLGSLSKPINVAAVMTLFDQGKFQLDDRVKKFLHATRVPDAYQRGWRRGMLRRADERAGEKADACSDDKLVLTCGTVALGATRSGYHVRLLLGIPLTDRRAGPFGVL